MPFKVTGECQISSSKSNQGQPRPIFTTLQNTRREIK